MSIHLCRVCGTMLTEFSEKKREGLCSKHFQRKYGKIVDYDENDNPITSRVGIIDVDENDDFVDAHGAAAQDPEAAKRFVAQRKERLVVHREAEVVKAEAFSRSRGPTAADLRAKEEELCRKYPNVIPGTIRFETEGKHKGRHTVEIWTVDLEGKRDGDRRRVATQDLFQVKHSEKVQAERNRKVRESFIAKQHMERRSGQKPKKRKAR